MPIAGFQSSGFDIAEFLLAAPKGEVTRRSPTQAMVVD